MLVELVIESQHLQRNKGPTFPGHNGSCNSNAGGRPGVGSSAVFGYAAGRRAGSTHRGHKKLDDIPATERDEPAPTASLLPRLCRVLERADLVLRLHRPEQFRRERIQPRSNGGVGRRELIQRDGSALRRTSILIQVLRKPAAGSSAKFARSVACLTPPE